MVFDFYYVLVPSSFALVGHSNKIDYSGYSKAKWQLHPFASKKTNKQKKPNFKSSKVMHSSIWNFAIFLSFFRPLGPSFEHIKSYISNRSGFNSTLYSGAENSKLSLLFSFNPNWTLHVCVCIIRPCDYVEHTHT